MQAKCNLRSLAVASVSLLHIGHRLRSLRQRGGEIIYFDRSNLHGAIISGSNNDPDNDCGTETTSA